MKVLVTGGSGYLGSAVVKALVERGYQVSCLQRGKYPHLNQLGIDIHQGDIAEAGIVSNASKDCEMIIHIAGLTGIWGPYSHYYHTNVTGTKQVIEACLHNGIRKLVYTSSPSVIFDGSDEENVNESMSYPQHYFNHYQRTKSEAEKMVLAANSKSLATVALRPHLIWGPDDPHLIARIIDRAKTGRLRLVKGILNRVDTTYIDNAVDAHLLAADHIDIGSSCAGKVYFITNGEPIPMSDLINRILKAAGMSSISKTAPASILYLIGQLSELIYRLLNINSEPLMTRFVAKQLSCAHWYDISAARQDLGYEPRVSIDEGMERLRRSLTADHT